MSILNLIRSELLEGAMYLPGSENSTHRLHANELPWSAVTADSIDLNFYPELKSKLRLQEQLAKRYQINTDQIVVTRGSDDAIDLVFRLFLQAGNDALMQFPPTFSMYQFYARLQQAQVIDCPLDYSDNFSLSIERINEHWQEHCKLIMLCNPNNPTAHSIDLEFIATLCEHYKDRSLIVVDEAYIEFAETQSATCLLNEFDNLIVLKTLSKAYGLAGLRLGAIIAQPQVIEACNKIIAPYPISSIVIQLALQALANDNWFASAITKIKAERVKLINALQDNPLIEKIYPSETNFVLIKTTHAKELTSWFTTQDITIKSFSPDSILHHHLRITVGDEQQNMLLMAALSSFHTYVSGP